jgi:hypothetical protein
MQTKPSTTEQLNKFIEFRQWVYEQALTHERDAQFELIEAILFSPAVQSFAARSLSPVFQRGWPSLSTAVERGQVDVNWLRHYLTQQVPTQTITVFALDTSVWPRPQTRTVADLRYEQSPTEAIRAMRRCKAMRIQVWPGYLNAGGVGRCPWIPAGWSGDKPAWTSALSR